MVKSTPYYMQNVPWIVSR